MKNRFLGNISQAHLWIDIALLNSSYLVAVSSLVSSTGELSRHVYLNILLIANLLWIFCVYIVKPYAFTRTAHNSYAYFGRHLLAIVAHFAMFEILLVFGDLNSGIHESVTFTGFQLFALSSVLAHVVIILCIRQLRRSGYRIKRFGVIGNDYFNAWVNHFRDEHREIGYEFRGMFQFADKPKQLENLENFMENERLDFIYCCLSEMNNDQVMGVLKLAERKRTQVRLVPDFEGMLNKQYGFEPLESYSIIDLNNKPLSDGDSQTIKRAFDITFSVVVMLLGLPVFALVMLAVKLTSKGSIFFTQERTGRWGEKFQIIKFRTMYMDAEKYGLQHSQGRKDPRITPFGNFLRQTRIDELPQFLNVLKGDMSIVGPRPLNHYDVEMLMSEARHEFQKVLTVRPGITSIGQIKVGYATNVSENIKRLKYDLLYLDTYSLRTDLYLIIMTIQVILLGKGK